MPDTAEVTLVINDPRGKYTRLVRRFQDISDIYYSIRWAYLVTQSDSQVLRDILGQWAYTYVLQPREGEARIESFTLRELFESGHLRGVLEPRTLSRVARDTGEFLDDTGLDSYLDVHLRPPQVLKISKSNPVSITLAVVGGTVAVGMFVTCIQLADERIKQSKARTRIMNAEAERAEHLAEEAKIRVELRRRLSKQVASLGEEPDVQVAAELVRPVVRPLANVARDPLVDKVNIGLAVGGG